MAELSERTEDGDDLLQIIYERQQSDKLQLSPKSSMKDEKSGKNRHLHFSGTGRTYATESLRASRKKEMVRASEKTSEKVAEVGVMKPLSDAGGSTNGTQQRQQPQRPSSAVPRLQVQRRDSPSLPGAFAETPSAEFNPNDYSDSDVEEPDFEATVSAHLVEEDEQVKDQEIERLMQELAVVKQQLLTPSSSIVMAEPVKAVQPFDIQTAKEDVIKEDPKKPRTSSKKLPFDSMQQKLFGRDQQLQQLQRVVERLQAQDQGDSSAPRKQFLQIGGLSGSGKSTLAEELKRMVDGGLYLSGKIDAFLGNPYAALSSALEGFCQSMLGGGGAVSKEAFRVEFGNQLDDEDLDLLVPIMPSICKVLGRETTSRDNLNFMECKARFQHAVKKFLQVLCSFGSVVLVIDDTQWVQQSLLELMGDLLEHQYSAGLLMVTTYRDNEVGQDHIYCKAVGQWKELTSITFTDILTGDLGQKDVLRLLETLLSISEETKLAPLAACVHKKTLGHCFFVKEFLLSLHSNGLLFYDEAAGVWNFDIKDILEAADATDNVVGLLTDKLHKLDTIVQSMLPKLAALGSTFPSTVAQIVVHDSISGSGDTRGSTELLLLLIQVGLLVECRRGWFKWEHDKLREAALSFTFEEDIQEIRFKVGKLILRELSQEELHTSIFTVTDLLNSMAATISSTDPLYDQLINLNLRSGQMALKTSAFNASAMYLDFGISLLPDSKWTSHFEDTLELYSTAAEAQLTIGDHIKCKEYVDEVNSSPCLFLQRKRVNNVLVASLYAQERTVEARDVMVGLLTELGCNFPRYGRSVKGPLKIVSIAMSVNKTTDILSRAPPMMDEEKKWAIALLDKLATVIYICDKPLLPLAIARALSWSLKYGKCESSAPVLATVALILAGSLGDFAGGKKFADVALSFMDSSTASRTIFLSYQFTMHTQIPNKECIAALQKGYVSGLRSGDLESAFWCEYSALETRVDIGDYLPGVTEAFNSLHLKLATQKNEMISYGAKAVHQVAKNLSDPDTSNHRTIDSVFHEEYARLNNVNEGENSAEAEQHMRRYADRIGVSAAFWIYDYGDALRIINENQYWKLNYEKWFPGANGTGALYFYCALTLLFAPMVSNRKQLAKKFLKQLRAWVKKGNPNVRHYVSLIEADLASANKKPAKVVEDFYKKAVTNAIEDGCMNHVALATERYGDHLVRTLGSGAEAKEQYQEALKKYKEYGALGRATLLQKRHNLDD